MARRGLDEDLKYNKLRLITPAIEGPSGPMNHSQPALDGELPPDPLGYVPDDKEK